MRRCWALGLLLCLLLAAPAAAEEPAPAAAEEPAPAPRPGRSVRRNALYVGAAAAVLTATAGLYAWRASSKWSEVNDAADQGVAWTHELQQAYDNAQTFERNAKILVVAGSALTVIGAIMYYQGWRRDREAQASARVAVTPLPGGAGVGFTCAW